MADLADGWRGWLLGIVATLIVALITNGIIFQRETRESLAVLTQQQRRNEERMGNILAYLQERFSENFQRIDKRLDELEKRR